MSRDRRWLLAAVTVVPLLRWAVLVHSVPPGAPWQHACPGCGTPYAPGSARTLGVLAPAGRCAGCRRRVGAPAGTVEAAAAVGAVVVAVGLASGWWSSWSAVALVGWLPFAVPLVFVDLAVHRLPDRFTLPAAGWVLGWLGVAALVGGTGLVSDAGLVADAGLVGDTGDAWVRAAVAGAGCSVGFALVTLVFGSRGFGLGDAKLVVSAAALLAWAGWTALLAGLLFAFFSSGATAGVLLATRRVGRRDALPFGPFLVLGVCATVVWVAVSA